MKILVLLSGGLKSAALAADFKDKGHEVQGLFFDYGQTMGGRERHMAKKVAEALGIDLAVIDLKVFDRLDRDQDYKILQPDLPHETVTPDIIGLHSTMLVLGGVMAANRACGAIASGLRAGDGSYHEASNLAMGSIQSLYRTALGSGVTLLTPFLRETGAKIIQNLAVLPGGARFFVLSTSCLSNRPTACTVCRGCKARVENFTKAGIRDTSIAAAQPKKLAQKEKVEEPEATPAK